MMVFTVSSLAAALASLTDQESVDWATTYLQPLGWEQGKHVGAADEQRSGPPGS